MSFKVGLSGEFERHPTPPPSFPAPCPIFFYLIWFDFTFCSISNLGMFPVDRFCAIINPPQVYDNLRFSESFCLYFFHYYQYQQNYGLSFYLDTRIKSLISLPNHSHLWFRYLTISIEYGFIKGPLCTHFSLVMNETTIVWRIQVLYNELEGEDWHKRHKEVKIRMRSGIDMYWIRVDWRGRTQKTELR